MDLRRRLEFHLWYLRETPPWDTGITPPEVVQFISSHPPGRAIDLGCGTGTNAITLAQHGWQVTGVDFAWSAIRSARRKAKKAGAKVDFRVDSVIALRGIQGPFDLALDIGCFHNLPLESRPIYLDNIRRLLSPAGTYLLYVHFKVDPTAQGHGVVEADFDLIAGYLQLISRQDGMERGIMPSAWLACRLKEAE